MDNQCCIPYEPDQILFFPRHYYNVSLDTWTLFSTIFFSIPQHIYPIYKWFTGTCCLKNYIPHPKLIPLNSTPARWLVLKCWYVLRNSQYSDVKFMSSSKTKTLIFITYPMWKCSEIIINSSRANLTFRGTAPKCGLWPGRWLLVSFIQLSLASVNSPRRVCP